MAISKSNILSVRFPKDTDIKKANKNLAKLTKKSKCKSDNEFIVNLINNADKYDIQHFDFGKQI